MSRRSRNRAKSTTLKHSKKNAGTNTGKTTTKAEFADRNLAILAMTLVVMVAWMAYANSLHNSLTFDDVTFSPGNRSMELSLANVGAFFSNDVWASAGKVSGLYRPVFLLGVAMEMKIFGSWYVGFHLVNVLLHSLVCLALFGLIRHLFLATGSVPRLSVYAALLAAIVYAVHPVHTETVNSIFNRSGIWVALGVVAGLWWFLPRVGTHQLKSWAGLNLIFLVILFCKETAVTFPAITAIILFVVTPGDWQQRVRQCIPVISMLLPLAVYFTFRAIALSSEESVSSLLQISALQHAEELQHVGDLQHVGNLQHGGAVHQFGALQQVGDLQQAGTLQQAVVEAGTEEAREPLLNRLSLGFDPGKLYPAIRIWFEALLLMVWPHPILAFHGPASANFWLAFSVQAAMIGLAVTSYLRKYPGPLLGLAIFYVALLPTSQIFSQSAVPPVLAERFLYLPAVGLAISLAFLLYWLFSKLSVRIVAVLILSFASVLTPLTWARNADWRSTVAVTESDYKKGSRNVKNLQALVSALILERDFSRARQICDRHRDQLQLDWFLSATCGQVYERSGLIARAEKAYMSAQNSRTGKASAHYSLGLLYARQNRTEEAQTQFELAVKAEKQPYMKELITAEMLMKLYPTQRTRLLEARNHLETAIRLNPHFSLTQTKLDELNIMLNDSSEQRQ